VRDAFYASPLFPRLLNADTIKDTIARGVSQGQLAYVGKLPGERYRPFNFGSSLSTADVEISDEMFIVTGETAQTYSQRLTQGAAVGETSAPEVDVTAGGGRESQPASGAGELFPEGALGGSGAGEGAGVGSSAISWRGEVPAQKWMNFYTRVLTKLGVGDRLKLTVNVEYKLEEGAGKQKISDLKSALRELGLSDRLDEL
jgi:hypothetical protein